MRAMIILAGLSLASCAGTPAIKTQIVEKRIPVPVACIDKARIPTQPALLGVLPPDARQAADALAAKAKELRGWGQSLSALLLACAAD